MAAEMGDAKERFASLFNRHYNDVLTYARRRVRPDEAQEIAAETFLIAWRRFDDVPDAPLPWLYRIASLEIANAVRKQVRWSGLLDRIQRELEIAPSEGDWELFELTTAVAHAFSMLDEGDQEALRLSAWEGLNARDAAKVLGCTAATYRVRLHRARRRLKYGTRGISMKSSPTTEDFPQATEGAS